MAITACRECGQQVSTEALSCPHCGVPDPMPELVWVSPPGWPPPPADWKPPPVGSSLPDGFTPNPDWPPAPPGWQFWQPAGSAAAATAAPPAPSKPTAQEVARGLFTTSAGLKFVALLAVLGLLVVGVVGALLSGGGEDDRAAEAKRVCESFVEQRLKAPATADFATTSTRFDSSYEAYVVSGAVDSENGFGAKIRSTYTCMARPDGDDWRLVDMQFSDGGG